LLAAEPKTTEETMTTRAAAKTTTDHDEIRRWVEKNGGCPARVKATGRGKNDPGILRIDYPGFSGQDTLVKMDWDEWFEAFDVNRLAFLYQPRTRFSKLVSRSTTARRTATAGRRGGAKKTATRAPKRGTARRATAKTGTTTAKRGTKRSAARSTRTAKRPAKRTTKRTGRSSRQA
jgi:hypothetical protein